MQVDVSQTGFVTAGLLAMFRKLGQPIKTVVPPEILEAVASGSINPTPLEWATTHEGRVPCGQAVFYSIQLSAQDLETGLLIFGTCPSARLKVRWRSAPSVARVRVRAGVTDNVPWPCIVLWSAVRSFHPQLMVFAAAAMGCNRAGWGVEHVRRGRLLQGVREQRRHTVSDKQRYPGRRACQHGGPPYLSAGAFAPL